MSKKRKSRKEKIRTAERRAESGAVTKEEVPESRAARKYRRKAKRGYGNAAAFVLTAAMFVLFWIYGFYYGGIAIAGDLTGIAENIPKNTGVLFIAADLLMLAGMIISFCKRYILQGFFTVTGSGLFLWTGHRVVADIRERMDKYGVTPDIENMDRDYMKHYYPAAAITVIGLVIMAAGAAALMKKRRAEREKRDNAPVKSIID